MKSTDLAPGMKVLYTDDPAGPNKTSPANDGEKVTVVKVGVEHSYYASAGFDGYGGGPRTVSNGVLIRRENGSEFTCRPRQLWSMGEHGQAWEDTQKRQAAYQAADEALDQRVQRLEGLLDTPVARVSSYRRDSPAVVTIELDVLERLVHGQEG